MENLRKAKYNEWLGSLLGACLIALGLGSLFAESLKPIVWWLIVAGVLLHGWGMYKIHQRNKV